MSHRYDAIIIGTGQAAPALANRLSGAGMSVAIIERHPPLDGRRCLMLKFVWQDVGLVGAAHHATAHRHLHLFPGLVTSIGAERVALAGIEADHCPLLALARA